MDILFIISSPDCGSIARELARAASRAKVSWAVFITNDGVRVLEDKVFVKVLNDAATAVVCQESWQKYLGNKVCPIETGSQTNHSMMVAKARRIISL